MTSSTPRKTPPLRTIRKAQGLTLAEVADRAGMDIGHLSRVERGIDGLSIDSLVRVGAALGLRAMVDLIEPYRSEQSWTATSATSREQSPASTPTKRDAGLGRREGVARKDER